MWSSYKGAPTLRPMAMRTVSLDIRRLREETGRAFNHAPDSGEAAPSNQDLEMSSA